MKNKSSGILPILILTAGAFLCSLPAIAQTPPTPPPAASPAPVSPAAAASTAEAVKTPQAGWVHQVFGPAMSPLWVCSITLIALVFNRRRAMRRKDVLPPSLVDEVGQCLGNLDVPKAIQVAENSHTLIGRAWARGLKEFNLGFTQLNDALANPSVVALKSLRKNLWLITTISVIAPMFGLIGTVVGMIITFSTLAETGGVDKAKLAVGLSFALYKTAGGLIIAIPAIIAGRYFASRVASYAEEVEDEILKLSHTYSKALSQADSRPKNVPGAPVTTAKS